MNTRHKENIPHKINFSKLKGVLLIGLALLTIGVVWQGPESVSATFLFQSPLPPEEIPPDDEPDVPEDDMAAVLDATDIDVCASKTKQCITFDYLGYETATDGTTTLQFRVTNHCNQKVKWVEIVSRQWERIDPAKNSVYTGDLGNYTAKWVKDTPNHPNRIGYRFKPEFNTFKQDASDTFSIQVENFNPNRRIRLRAKVGNHIDRAGLRPIRFDCGSTPGPTPTPPNSQDICLSKSDGQVTFDFYGYVNNGDGTTTLTFSVTNPRQRKLDAIGFKARSWSRLSPADQSVYTGMLGTYRVRWITHNNTPNREAFRFKTQGNWFRQGATDQFTITVNNFDPTKRITAWVELGYQWIEVKGRLSEHDCDQTAPTATATPTATPVSPLPTPTPTPNVLQPTPTSIPTMSPDVSTAAINYITQQHNLPADTLHVAAPYYATFPNLGLEYINLAVVDQQGGGRIYRLLVDPVTLSIEPDVGAIKKQQFPQGSESSDLT